MRTKETIEAAKTETVKTPDGAPKKERPAWQRGLVAPWKPGQSGNPGGRPKKDLRQVIARAVFENNAEEIYKAYTKLLLRGSAFGYQVVGEAGYGKLKETREIGLEYNELPDDQVQEEIERIMSRIGLAREADRAAETGIATARAEKANGKAQDPHVLPGNGTVKA